jgi:hypothetical protein
MTAISPEAPVGLELTHKSLIAESLWKRLVNRVAKDLEFQKTFSECDVVTQYSWAERIMDQALGYLKLTAMRPGESFAPSPLVDIGWHSFILYTREYAEFCDHLVGRFIHHAPTDEGGVSPRPSGPNRTSAAMRVAGISLDEMLWSADCGCRCGARKDSSDLNAAPASQNVRCSNDDGSRCCNTA